MTFVDNVLGYGSYVATSDIQSEALEMIFGIAAKIRLEPELLPVWFRKKPDLESGEKVGVSDGIEQDDFPLCHQFVAHVYDDGRAGDFARTGLLYLLESASNSLILEEWIATSDLPTLMASGLGALYSQMSRKLTIARPQYGVPLILALSDNQHRQTSVGVESFLSADLQSRFATFMSYMVFWQDVLEHCHSVEIKQTLLDRFRVEFLQQILYPSLLESSDVDGGSAVAVLTYLGRILDSVSHPDLIHLILHYLLALPGPVTSRPITPRTPSKERGSLLFSDSEPTESALNPSFFNLTDLILASCQSVNPETMIAALRLVGVILEKHHHYAVSSLVRIVPSTGIMPPMRSAGAFLRDMEHYVRLAKDICGSADIDKSYEYSLKDSLVYIEAHPCSHQILRIGTLSSKTQANPKGAILNDGKIAMCAHNISPSDPLLKQIDALLQSFFTNNVEINLALTSVISQLASCPYVRLEGWLVHNEEDVPLPEFDDTNGDHLDRKDGEDSDEAEDRRIKAWKVVKRIPSTPLGIPAPQLLKTLDSLVDILSEVKVENPEIEALLPGRKRAFQTALEIEHETRHDPAQSASLTPRRSVEQSRDVSSSRAIPASSQVPKRQSVQEPLSTSPRGRAMSLITGQGRSSQAGSPRSVTSKRPTPLDSPLFRPRDGSRRPSRSPNKTLRALSPLSANVDADETGLWGASPFVGSTNEEIFERLIRFPTVENVEMARKSKTEDDRKTNDQSDAKEDVVEVEKVEVKADEEDGPHVAVGNSKSRTSAGNDTEEDISDTAMEVSLTHVLTNAVILQEFVLELAAIMHVRAGLLDGEIKFL